MYAPWEHESSTSPSHSGRGFVAGASRPRALDPDQSRLGAHKETFRRTSLGGASRMILQSRLQQNQSPARKNRDHAVDHKPRPPLRHKRSWAHPKNLHGVDKYLPLPKHYRSDVTQEQGARFPFICKTLMDLYVPPIEKPNVDASTSFMQWANGFLRNHFHQ